MPLKIIMVASECSPIIKVGGLADVVGALPKALKSLGVDISVILPFYEIIDNKKITIRPIKREFSVLFNGKEEGFRIWKTFLPKSRVPLFLVENKKYFSGKGVYVESDASSGGSRREAARFLFLSAASIEIAKKMRVSLIHCHDWHVAIIPFLVRERGLKIKTLLTIHNLGYQGIYPAEIVNRFLKTRFSEKEINCLKLGILNADYISTVSPSYAKEILTPKFGAGLHHYLRKKKRFLRGIVNGLDYDLFNPGTDRSLKNKYSYKTLEKKSGNKVFLQEKCFGKANPKIPILSIVSRLAEQKGINLIEKIFTKLMKEDLQFILLGTGNPDDEKFFKEVSESYKDKFWCKLGFDERLAHQIYGGTDIFLMPSVFEPCGLGQQIAMKYGTVPLARAVGGIKDTVSETKIEGKRIKGTGFLFKRYDASTFLKTIRRALNIYKQKEIWKEIQINGMKKDLSWKRSAKNYRLLYEKILK